MPVGGAVTMIEYWNVDVFTPGHLLNIYHHIIDKVYNEKLKTTWYDNLQKPHSKLIMADLMITVSPDGYVSYAFSYM